MTPDEERDLCRQMREITNGLLDLLDALEGVGRRVERIKQHVDIESRAGVVWGRT